MRTLGTLLRDFTNGLNYGTCSVGSYLLRINISLEDRSTNTHSEALEYKYNDSNAGTGHLYILELLMGRISLKITSSPGGPSAALPKLIVGKSHASSVWTQLEGKILTTHGRSDIWILDTAHNHVEQDEQSRTELGFDEITQGIE